MIDILEKKYTENITILHQDVLQFAPAYEQYSVIANIPYYITSPILSHFLYASDFTPPESMIIMMQEEVGEKILE
jgi:16S rRNA (adenine1518-N6/adenine1519-N6)-dimethyltransferase